MYKLHNNIAQTIHKVLSDNKAKDITKINLEKTLRSGVFLYHIIK